MMTLDQQDEWVREAVIKLIDDDGLFNYTQFLDSYKDQDDIYSNTLKLFAYGTFKDFSDNKSIYLDLSDKQLSKLKQLSMTSYSSDRVVEYARLRLELDLESNESVEELFISAVNNNLIQGKLNQLSNTLTVHSNIKRDIHSIDIHSLKNFLDQYSANIKQLLGSFNDIEVSNANHINHINHVNTQHQQLFSKAIQYHKSHSSTKPQQPSSRKRNRAHP
ncbi:hypothetical protein E3P92_00595 [Wallemia ichthyophaga]|uniref:PCI domain-containing protein n=1 Tax=Wallemia ichthyophaga TaxID=245174 RepID=A0A4T0GSV5_WALIC|nr:hypothetical protein E3P95_02159 [Wallemia ichthyophaga]TIB04501.1 hypothetical protein E3P94_00541 [Wallemia ichthyophaga]TIB18444.1 hypothetical protein E3P92_00595 [Wallemia ichthyophaga]TIB43243.1 hypothetical protein E3P86_00029 [Wallemia ichthyophaga]TIB65970.1 hypothetical protein E3P78_00224 [Wallemia ichthyophaga]